MQQTKLWHIKLCINNMIVTKYYFMYTIRTIGYIMSNVLIKILQLLLTIIFIAKYIFIIINLFDSFNYIYFIL